MSPRSKLSLQWMANAAAHRRLPTAMRAGSRRLRSRTSSVQFLQCNAHHCCGRFPPLASSSQRWPIPLQHRRFGESSLGSQVSAAPVQAPVQEDDTPSIAAETEPTDKEHSLHSNVHYIFKRIPIGRMHDENKQKARAFISIVSKWHNEQGATLAEALLERLHKEQTSRKDLDAIVDSEMYNICMDAWNQSGADGSKIVGKVEAIIRRMEERYLRGSEEDTMRHAARPDRFSFNCLINAYSKCDADSSIKAEAVLEKMYALANDADEDYKLLIRPDTITYNSLMNYYASRQNGHLAAERAEDLLLQMSERSRQGEDTRMDATSFNIVLKAWSNSGGGINAAERAETVLRMMIKYVPDVVGFSTVIRAYAKVNPEDAPAGVEKAMALLDELEGLHFAADANVTSCYSAAAHVVVKSGLPDAVDRVKGLIDRMRNMDATPDLSMYISCVEAYANEGKRLDLIKARDESFRQGAELLSEIMGGSEPKLEPSVIPFNVLLNAMLEGNDNNKIDRAEELIATMKEVGGNARPDLTTYNVFLSSLSQSRAPGKAEKAVDHLRDMLKSYSGGYEAAKPESFVFNCVIGMLASSKEQEWAENTIYRTLMAMESQKKRGNAAVIPDTIAYNSVISKLAQSPTKENAKKAMKLLTDMEESAKSGGAIAPDIITYTNVLRIQEKVNPLRAAYVASSCLERAMAKDGKMPIDRVGFLGLLLALSKSHKMEHATLARKAWEWMEEKGQSSVLDSGLCNLVLIAYSKARDPRAVEEALSFLTERIKRCREGDKSAILPTVVGFGAATAILGKSGRIDDALRLLETMRALSKEGVPDVKPDVGCYAFILGSLWPQAENAETNALKIALQMKEDFGTIPTASLNAAIGICSEKGGQQAIKIAGGLLQLGRESKSCDADTFGLVIKTCMSTGGDDEAKYKLVEPIFMLCAKSGLVARMVMKEIKPLRKRLVPDGQLPPEWTANAGDK